MGEKIVNRIKCSDLSVDECLFKFVEESALPGTGIASDTFWSGFSEIVHELGPQNKALLDKREDLQAKLDAWHIEHRGQAHDAVAYKAFLQEIGYLVAEGDDFEIDTANVDPEIATIAGPQLVVPLMNAR